MAAGTRLELTFNNSAGKKIIFSFNYAKPAVSTANVKALMNSIITNGSIFTSVPTEAVSAKCVTVTENEYDLSI